MSTPPALPEAPEGPDATATDADRLALRVAKAMLAREGAGPAWDLEIEAARLGYARVSMRVRPDMLNGHGTAHGGMLFALADAAFAYACNSDNQTTVAQQASIAFLSPGRPGERLTAEAVALSRSGRSGVYRVSVRGEDRRAVAEFTGVSRTVGGPVVED